jgi:hypothetical protein
MDNTTLLIIILVVLLFSAAVTTDEGAGGSYRLIALAPADAFLSSAYRASR